MATVHDGLGGGHGCHLLTKLTRLVAHQGGHVISNSEGLGAHGAALGINGVPAIHAEGRDQQVVAPVVCRPFDFGVELEELLRHVARCSLGAECHALFKQGLPFVGSLGDARVVVLDLVQVLHVHPSPMRVVVVAATQPVLEGRVGNVDHEDGKGVL
eukprot:2136726-Pleurochrysis_carterae.AAC.2